METFLTNPAAMPIQTRKDHMTAETATSWFKPDRTDHIQAHNKQLLAEHRTRRSTSRETAKQFRKQIAEIQELWYSTRQKMPMYKNVSSSGSPVGYVDPQIMKYMDRASASTREASGILNRLLIQIDLLGPDEEQSDYDWMLAIQLAAVGERMLVAGFQLRTRVIGGSSASYWEAFIRCLIDISDIWFGMGLECFEMASRKVDSVIRQTSRGVPVLSPHPAVAGEEMRRLAYALTRNHKDIKVRYLNCKIADEPYSGLVEETLTLLAGMTKRLGEAAQIVSKKSPPPVKQEPRQSSDFGDKPADGGLFRALP